MKSLSYLLMLFTPSICLALPGEHELDYFHRVNGEQDETTQLCYAEDSRASHESLDPIENLHMDLDSYKNCFFYPDNLNIEKDKVDTGQMQTYASILDKNRQMQYEYMKPRTDLPPPSINYEQAFRPPMPALRWQHKLLRWQVDYLNERLWSTWPKDVTDKEKIHRHVYNISKWLQRYPKVVDKLLKNDENAWNYVIKKCMLNPDKEKRNRKIKNKNSDHVVNPVWLAKPIMTSKREEMFANLCVHWNVSREIVKARVFKYVDQYGKIQSPEPLLLGIDNAEFRRAANAIWCDDAPRGFRQFGASKSDILHQYSKEYSITVPHIDDIDNGNEEKVPVAHVPRTSRRIKSNSVRFNTGEEWMRGMTLEQISDIHGAIRKYWIDGLSNYLAQSAYIAVNEFLETNEGYLERIQKGDEDATYFVAQNTVGTKYMKDPPVMTLLP